MLTDENLMAPETSGKPKYYSPLFQFCQELLRTNSLLTFPPAQKH